MRSEGSSSNTSSSSTRGILDKLSTIALCHSDTVLEGEDEVVIVPDSRTENYESCNANYNMKVAEGKKHWACSQCPQTFISRVNFALHKLLAIKQSLPTTTTTTTTTNKE